MPIVRQEFLNQHPEVETVLNLLSGRINDSIMTELNFKVDYLKQSPEKVTRDFLVEQKLDRDSKKEMKGF